MSKSKLALALEIALKTKNFQKIRGINKLFKKTSKATKELEKSIGGLDSLLATLGVSVGTAEILKMADDFKNLEARIKLATGEGANFITGFEGVQEIANNTFSNVEDTGELFARLTQASESLNLAQNDVLAVTETINQAVKLSGGSVEGNKAAITQLIQGLQSGVLRGEEFNSVLEQSPRLARAMADGLGVTVGQLRAMSQEGKLTSETVISSLQGQADVIANEFKTLPNTVGNSLIQLKNNIINFVGEIDKEVNSSGGLASLIQGIADGIEDIDPAILDAVKESFQQLGNIAHQLGQAIDGTGETFQDLLNTVAGVDDANEQVGFFTRTMQGLSISIGAVSDGLEAISIIAKTVFGGMIVGASQLVKAYEKITGKTSELSDSLMTKGSELLESAQKQALAFQSSAVSAMDEATKTMQQRMDETAQNSKKAYEQMANDGVSSAGKIQEAFVKYAEDTIKANNNVVSERLKIELAEQKLQAVISETGNISITQAEKMQQSVDSQLTSQQKLTQQLELTKQRLQELTDQATVFELNGEKDSNAYKNLQKEIDNTKQKLTELQAESVEFGGLLKADLEKASGAFKAIGLDASEFATGISSDVNTALDAYVQVSKLAGDNTELLARAYGATQEKIKGNTEAQSLLDEKLAQVTQGNKLLAEQVKATAKAQKDAKTATDDQAKALDKLGVSMEAVNAKMSESGLEMVQNLKTGITAIKEQATSADALKTALSQALDVSIQSAKTKADFEAIKKTIDDTGVSAKVSAEQMKLISQGVAGGADGIKKQAQAMADYTESLDKNTESAEKNAIATQAQADASKQVTEAVKEQNQAMQQATVTTVDMSNSMVGWSNQQIHGLQELGLSAQQTQTIMDNLFNSIVGNRYANDKQYNDVIESLTNNAVQQAQAFARLKNEASEVAQSLGSATVSSNDLSHAQGLLKRATTASVNGLIRMDEQTLDNLRNAISDARQRMQDLASDAKNTADSLEASLAKLKGDDNAVKEFQQRKKILELEQKIQEARRAGNAQAEEHYKRALSAQKRINAEEDKQAQKRKQQQQQNRQQATGQSNSSLGSQSTNSTGGLTESQIADMWEERIKQAEERGAEKGAQKIMERLADEAKRRAR